MTTFSYNPVQKPNFKRSKPTAKKRGAISPATRAQLTERSGGRCERCGRGGVVLQAAHTVRRWKIEKRTTVNELAHLCVECHTWGDTTREGRKWLEEFRLSILHTNGEDESSIVQIHTLPEIVIQGRKYRASNIRLNGSGKKWAEVEYWTNGRGWQEVHNWDRIELVASLLWKFRS